MRTILFLLRKEFKQIFRNKALLGMVIVVPIIQLILLPLAADYEIKNVNIAIVDHDHSPYSEKLVHTIPASGYFKLIGYSASYSSALVLIEADKADLILEIPAGFERNLIREGSQEVFIAVNAINGTKAAIGGNYLSQILMDFNSKIRTQLLLAENVGQQPIIQTTASNWYNPHLNYHLLMVPGVLAMLVTLIGGFLSSLNIVREKEMGTIEQINVTPIKKHQFILGKLIPFWILGNLVFTIGLLVSWLVYAIIPVGNIALLYGFIAVYLLAVLGLGLLVSTWSDTQQQAMFIMFFFMMVFILMSGLFTPIESMPQWAQVVAALNPVSYLIEVMRMIILKGSSLTDVLSRLGIIAGFAIALNGLAILNYKKTS